MARGMKTGGRQPDLPNKTTVAAKHALQLAFDGAGGVDALTQWARENRSEFYRLYARLVPIDLGGALHVRQDVSDEPMTAEEWEARYSPASPLKPAGDLK